MVVKIISNIGSDPAATAFNINQQATATALDNTITAETEAYKDVATVN